jgi:hypothetical protein
MSVVSSRKPQRDRARGRVGEFAYAVPRLIRVVPPHPKKDAPDSPPTAGPPMTGERSSETPG